MSKVSQLSLSSYEKKHRNMGFNWGTFDKGINYFEILSKVSQLNICFYVFSHDKRLNGETFDKDRDYFEILIESETNLKITYKDKDQIGGLLINCRLLSNGFQQ